MRSRLTLVWVLGLVAVALWPSNLARAQGPAGEEDETRAPWGAIVRAELDKRVLRAGETSIPKVTVTRDPVVMITYLPPIPLTDEGFAKAREDLDTLARGGCNSLCFPWNGNRRLHRDSYEKYIDMAHEKGFSVLLLPSAPAGYFSRTQEFVEEHPEVEAVDQHGNTCGFCINNPVLRDHFRDWMEECIPRNADAIGLDEPVYPCYTHTHKEGRLSCYCPVCKQKFRERYGVEMPRVQLPEDRTEKAHLWENLLEFRRDSMTDWMDFFHRTAKEIVPGIATVADFYSDNISFWFPRDRGWHCPVGEAQAIDVERIIALPSIDCVYMNTDSPRAMRRGYKGLFVELPRRHGKLAHYFTGYLRPYARPGSITQEVDAAMESGAEGFALWSPWICWVVSGGDHDKYWAMEQKYGLDEYLDELSRAVEVHKHTPVEDARVIVKGCGVQIDVEGDAADVGSNGIYEIELKPRSHGQMLVSVYYRGRAFFRESIRVQQ